MEGIILSLHIAAAAGAEMQTVEHALAVPRRGIDGGVFGYYNAQELVDGGIASATFTTA